MTLKETVLQEIETADDNLLQAVIQLIRSRPPAKPTLTLSDAIAIYRESAIAAGIDVDSDEIWGDVRDKTPADSEPRW
jgi:hypothetical protein